MLQPRHLEVSGRQRGQPSPVRQRWLLHPGTRASLLLHRQRRRPLIQWLIGSQGLKPAGLAKGDIDWVECGTFAKGSLKGSICRPQ